MVVIIKKKGESKDSIIKRLSRSFMEEEIQDNLKERQYYKRPSQVNKEKAKERLKRRRVKFRVHSAR